MTAAAHKGDLARVVDVAGGTREGDVDISDLAALRIPYRRLRPQLTSMHTLAWEALAQRAPTVSFVHEFPGAVYTSLHKDVPGVMGWVINSIIEVLHGLFGRWLFVPIDESGERIVFIATNGRYASRKASSGAVPIAAGDDVIKGSDGVSGSGVYSVNWDGEGPSKSGQAALADLRKRQVDKLVSTHFGTEFSRISGSEETTL